MYYNIIDWLSIVKFVCFHHINWKIDISSKQLPDDITFTFFIKNINEIPVHDIIHLRFQ